MPETNNDPEEEVPAQKPDDIAGENRSELLCHDCEKEFQRSDWEIVDADRINGEIFREIWVRDPENIMHIYGCEHVGYYDE